MTDPAATASVPEQPEPRRYALFLRHRTGFFWRLTDEGIMPGEEKLSYVQDGRWGYRLYSDIYSINLSTAHIPRQGSLAQCAIKFRNGLTLALSTAGAAGTPDRSREETYLEFIEDFHQRLIASGASKHIIFTRGGTETRMRVLYASLILGTIFFVLTPIVLAIIAKTWEPFQMMLMGGLLLWPAWESAHKNEPGTYNPKYPPDMLG